MGGASKLIMLVSAPLSTICLRHPLPRRLLTTTTTTSLPRHRHRHRSSSSLHTQPLNNNYNSSASCSSSHPWPEWSDVINTLLSTTGQGFSAAEEHAFVAYEEKQLSHDFVKVASALIDFAHHHPNLLGWLSRRNIEVVVSNGTPFLFKTALQTAKRMRGFLGVDGANGSESDKATTVDLVKYILSYASNPNVTSERNSIYSRELVKSSVRNLLRELIEVNFLVKNCPDVLDPEFLIKWKKGIEKMRLSGMKYASMQIVLATFRKFELDPDDFFMFVKFLEGLGFNQGAINSVLVAIPNVILMKEDSIRDRVKFLINFGVEREDLNYIVPHIPGVLAFGVENRLKPLLEEFEELGFSLDVVRKEVHRAPSVLGLEVGQLSQCLKLLRSLKCRIGIKQEIFSDGEFRAGYEVKSRVDCLRNHGLTCADAFSVLWKEPRVILYKLDEIEKKVDFLVHTMKYEIVCLVDVPEYLGVNLEKQIVPRYNVIEYLRLIGGLRYEVGLRAMIRPSRLQFYNRYVKPYPECEKIYGRFAGDVKVRSRHPVGMWKLFKPQKFPESNEDVMHIKSYMESLA